ncbi:hypothetical protein [Streptomyces sp. NPDC021020]|uniref:hypothetical protein n=1 Tax=Streptomyces sp. NPDC021020 TaxID=3365109 RepID=UPI0037BD1295
MSTDNTPLVFTGPEQIVSIELHGEGVIETLVVRSVTVFDRQPDGSLLELHGEEKRQALIEFWEGPC